MYDFIVNLKVFCDLTHSQLEQIKFLCVLKIICFAILYATLNVIKKNDPL